MHRQSTRVEGRSLAHDTHDSRVLMSFMSVRCDVDKGNTIYVPHSPFYPFLRSKEIKSEGKKIHRPIKPMTWVDLGDTFFWYSDMAIWYGSSISTARHPHDHDCTVCANTVH